MRVIVNRISRITENRLVPVTVQRLAAVPEIEPIEHDAQILITHKLVRYLRIVETVNKLYLSDRKLSVAKHRLPEALTVPQPAQENIVMFLLPSSAWSDLSPVSSKCADMPYFTFLSTIADLCVLCSEAYIIGSPLPFICCFTA